MLKTKQKIPKWFRGDVYLTGGMVTNPFSNEKFELTGLELSIYDFIMGSQIVMEAAPMTVTPKMITDFHNALSWFRKNNGEAYMVLLD